MAGLAEKTCSPGDRGAEMGTVGFSGVHPSRWRSCFVRPPPPKAVEAGGFLEPDPRP